MPSIQTQYKLADLLKALADGEKQIEIVRQILAEKSAFEPYTAFKRIDRDSTGNINTYDLLTFLRDNQILVTEKELRLIFQEQNTVRDDRITYTEFLNIILPKADSVLRQVVTQRESYFVARDEVLCYEVEHSLARVFEKEVELANRAEILRKDLADRYDFDALNLFKDADGDRLGSLDLDGLYAFLKNSSVPVSEPEVLSLLRRTDKDQDGRLTFSEFYNAIVSKDPYHKSVSPTLRVASPTRRVASPTRRVASPVRRVASPVRRVASPLRTTTSPGLRKTADKLSNVDYIDYVHTSASKVRSPGLGRSTPKKVASPVRTSITKRNLETELASTVSTASRASPLRESVRSPVKRNEEEHLANALKEQIEIDKEFENAKVDLALKRDFNLLDAFKFFDVEGKAFIGRTEIKETLNELGIFPTFDEISLILTKYDTNNEGKLRFTSFSEILTPKDTSYADMLNNRVPTYTDNVPLDQVFSEETIYLLKKALNAVIRNVVSSESIRQRLNRRPMFDKYDGFKSLDKDGTGYVRTHDVKDLLSDHGIYASYKDAKNLVDRFDKNQDGKVSYSDFNNEITPKSPTRY